MNAPIRTAETRREGDTEPRTSILLCGTQRVGTTLVCDLMTTTDRLGYPKEFFLDQARSAFLRGWGLPADADDSALLHHILRNGTSPNGVFAAKVMADQVETLDRMTNGRRFDVFPAAMFVWLRRGDRVAAAISQWRAERTGRWSSDAHPVGGALEIGDDDLRRISDLHHDKHAQDQRWASLLSGFPVHTVVYEQWVDDPGGLLADIADLVDVDLAGTTPASSLVKQSDATSEEVRRRWWRWDGECRSCPAPHMEA